MFNLPVIRSCGHKEIVAVTDSLPPGPSFLAALDKLDREEQAKLCSKCHAKEPEKKPEKEGSNIAQTIIVIAVWSGVMCIIGAMCMVILRY